MSVQVTFYHQTLLKVYTDTVHAPLSVTNFVAEINCLIIVLFQGLHVKYNVWFSAMSNHPGLMPV
jgi:hypothetical protein